MSSDSSFGYVRKPSNYWPSVPQKLLPSKFPTQVASLVRSAPYHGKTLLLFTKSDIKTIILPISVFALSLASRSSPSAAFTLSRIPAMLCWTWYTLLLFNIGNQTQTYSLEEDRTNKPWRPIPAGRISLKDAKMLENVLLVLVHGGSLVQGVFIPALFLYLLGYFYNVLGGHRTAFGRNAICALAYAGFGYGASSILELRTNFSLWSRLAVIDAHWVVVYAAIVLCTIQVADLGDIEGDEMLGRRTLPIVYGEKFTKAISTLGIVLASEIVREFWALSGTISGVVLLVGGIVVGGIVAWGEYHGPKNAYAWYCIWLMGIGLVPAFA